MFGAESFQERLEGLAIPAEPPKGSDGKACLQQVADGGDRRIFGIDGDALVGHCVCWLPVAPGSDGPADVCPHIFWRPNFENASPCFPGGDQLDTHSHATGIGRRGQQGIDELAAQQRMGGVAGELPVGAALAEPETLDDGEHLPVVDLCTHLHQAQVHGVGESQVGSQAELEGARLFGAALLRV